MNGRLYKLKYCTYICQYHLVWITKYRGKVMVFKYIKTELKRIIKLICRWKHWRIIQWHIGDEHIHLYIIIPPKYLVSYAVDLLKSKSSTWVKKKNKKIPKGSFWCVDYYLSTIGINEIAIKTYIRDQERIRYKNPELPL